MFTEKRFGTICGFNLILEGANATLNPTVSQSKGVPFDVLGNKQLPAVLLSSSFLESNICFNDALSVGAQPSIERAHAHLETNGSLGTS